MNKVIITISGRAESGKDTFGNILAFHFLANKYKVLRLNYADWLKKIMEKLVGYKEEDKIKWRTELQRVGTDVVRNTDENYWTDTAIGAFDILGEEANVMIVADARFKNEVELNKWRKKFVVINVLVKREKENNLTASQKLHASEGLLDEVTEDFFDYVIDNNGAVNDIYYLGEKIQKEIKDKFLV